MTACREYQGSRTVSGYGRIRAAGRPVLLHRWIVEQVEGPLAPGEVVMHSCDNPPCFLYEHLKRATQSENLLDAVAKGRHRFEAHVGERNGQAILTDEQVLEIRQLYRAGRGRRRGNLTDLASLFGVTERTIKSVVNREHWKHLP